MARKRQINFLVLGALLLGAAHLQAEDTATAAFEEEPASAMEFTCATDEHTEDLRVEEIATARAAVAIDPLFRVAPLEKQALEKAGFRKAYALEAFPGEDPSTLSPPPDLLQRQEDYLDIVTGLEASAEQELTPERREALKAEIMGR